MCNEASWTLAANARLLQSEPVADVASVKGAEAQTPLSVYSRAWEYDDRGWDDKRGVGMKSD